VSNKNTIRNAFLSLQQAQDLTKIAYNNLRNKSKICNNLKSNAIRENTEDTTKYKREAANEKDDNQSNEVENREIEKILEWLETK